MACSTPALRHRQLRGLDGEAFAHDERCMNCGGYGRALRRVSSAWTGAEQIYRACRQACHTSHRSAYRWTLHLQPRHFTYCSAMSDPKTSPTWVDCDAGADDALGLMVIANQVNIVGISTVRGNAAAEQVAHNVLRVLTLCSRLNVPVYIGADKSSNGDQKPLPEWSGRDGLGDQPDVFPASATITAKPAAGSGSAKLLEAAQEHKGSLTVVATGPLTNLAAALQADPSLPSLIKQVVIMGGNEEVNTFTKTGAEFNFECDPEAAQQVISKFSGKILLFTWESMQRNCIPRMFMQTWTNKATQGATFVNAICDLETYKDGKKKWVPCDPLAFAAVLNRSLVKGHHDLCCVVEIEDVSRRGRTYFSSVQGPDKCTGGVVRRVNTVDVVMFERMLDVATNSYLF